MARSIARCCAPRRRCQRAPRSRSAASKAYRSTTEMSKPRRDCRHRREAQGARRRDRRIAARDARVQQLDSRRVQERHRLADAAGRGHSARVRQPTRRRHWRVSRRIRNSALANRVAARAEDARHCRVLRRTPPGVARGRRVRQERQARRRACPRAAREVPRGLLRVCRGDAPRELVSVLGNHNPS